MSGSGNGSTKDIWDKAQVVGALAIPVALLILGHCFSESANERERMARVAADERQQRERSIELAVEILQAPPSEAKESTSLRDWAKRTLVENNIINDEVISSLGNKPLLGARLGGQVICGASVETPCGSCVAEPGSGVGFCCVACDQAKTSDSKVPGSAP